MNAVLAHPWAVLDTLLKAALSSTSTLSFDVLVLGCQHQAPVTLLERLAERHPLYPQETDRRGLWNDLFIQAARHDHLAILTRVWTADWVDPATRATAMMEVATRSPTVVEHLIRLGPDVDRNTLLKLASLDGGPARLDQVGVRLPRVEAQDLAGRALRTLHGDLPLTHQRLEAEARHQSAQGATPPSRSTHRRRS